jgi:hypothetical protein
MSRSYHVTYKDFKLLSKKGIDEEIRDPNSLFRQWAKKLSIKNSIPKLRRLIKQKKNVE